MWMYSESYDYTWKSRGHDSWVLCLLNWFPRHPEQQWWPNGSRLEYKVEMGTTSSLRPTVFFCFRGFSVLRFIWARPQFDISLSVKSPLFPWNLVFRFHVKSFACACIPRAMITHGNQEGRTHESFVHLSSFLSNVGQKESERWMSLQELTSNFHRNNPER